MGCQSPERQRLSDNGQDGQFQYGQSRLVGLCWSGALKGCLRTFVVAESSCGHRRDRLQHHAVVEHQHGLGPSTQITCNRGKKPTFPELVRWVRHD